MFEEKEKRRGGETGAWLGEGEQTPSSKAGVARVPGQTEGQRGGRCKER